MKTKKQFDDVNCSRGAPMGRREWRSDEIEPRSVRLFRVNLDSGGYDDGGAYWGLGQSLWCATDDANYREFTRASSRIAAIIELRIKRAMIKRAPLREINMMLALGGVNGEHLNEKGRKTVADLKKLGYIS